jgi:hypothetical protein
VNFDLFWIVLSFLHPHPRGLHRYTLFKQRVLTPIQGITSPLEVKVYPRSSKICPLVVKLKNRPLAFAMQLSEA